MIKPGYKLKKDGKIVGDIKELQAEGENVQKAKAGEKVAVSMDGVTIGRQINEGDTLDNALFDRDIEILCKIKHKLSADERQLLDEMGCCAGDAE
jgi:translation initiation factor 5B